MFTKKKLSADEKKLADTLNAFDREGVKNILGSIAPNLDFSFKEQSRSTRVFSEIRLDNLDPEMKSFLLDALDSSKGFSVERTSHGSPYDCAIYEKSLQGRVGVTADSQASHHGKLLEEMEAGISQYASSVRNELYGKGFPIKLSNPFSDTSKDHEGVLAKFRSKAMDRGADNSPTLA